MTELTRLSTTESSTTFDKFLALTGVGSFLQLSLIDLSLAKVFVIVENTLILSDKDQLLTPIRY